jgi:amidase
LPRAASGTTLHSRIERRERQRMGEISATSSAVALTTALRSGAVSARDLLETYLERIDRLDRDSVNAVVTVDAEGARQAAAAADEARARGELLGPLHGLPMTVKDAIATEGMRTTGGAVELAEYVPTEDAPAVARLKAAGAIVFGKTNLPRWCGDSQAYNELFGTTNNPSVAPCARPRTAAGCMR